MNQKDVIQNLLRTYQKYGVTMTFIERIMERALQYGFSYQTSYTGLRMVMGGYFNEQEYFTIEEIAEALGETPQAVMEELKQQRKIAKDCGENPDKYAVLTKPEEQKRFLILPGELK